MDQDETNVPNAMTQELTQLRQQLQFRDQLVAQLSTELFRMVKTHPPALKAAASPGLAPVAVHPINTEVEALREEVKQLEQQIEFYQMQIDKRDTEIARLQRSCQVLSERNQMLEHIIQELPEVYRQKFTDRLDLVKSKIQSLQTENRRLNSELQQVNGQGLPEIRSSAKRLSLPAKRNAPASHLPISNEDSP
ncbi:MAG: Npun_F5560 family protein [Thermosynechococcaceae cyanobacterium]